MPLPEQKRNRLAVVAATVLLPFLYFHRASFTDQIFIARDILRVYYPLKKYWAERMSQLQFPEWYPYNGLGQPYVGMLISGALHPANLLYLLLPLGTALKLVTLLSYVAALGGTYRFARLWGQGRAAALLAGITYALGGYLVGISNNLLYLMAAATFPWALWGAERFLRQPSARRAATAALPLCLLLLSGEPQSFAVCNAALLGLVLLRPERSAMPRAVPRVGVLIVLGALLSMVQILPVLGILQDMKPSAPDLEVATRFSFHPLRLFELALGPIFLDPDTSSPASLAMADELFHTRMSSFWVDSVHLGLPALLLLGTALWVYRREPRMGWVTGFALFILALSMANQLPLYVWFHRWVPFWSSFRYPEKLLPYFLFPCAVGAGAGLDVILREPLARKRLGVAALVGVLVCGLLALGEWGPRLFTDGLIASLWEKPQPRVMDVLHGNFLLAAVTGAVTLGVMGVVLLGVREPRLFAVALVALQLATLYRANEGVYQVTYPDLLEQPTRMVKVILDDEPDTAAGRYRVYGAAPDFDPRFMPEGLQGIDITSLNIASGLGPDTPALWHLESARPYLPATSSRYFGLLDKLPSLQSFLGRLAGLFSVRYIVVSAPEYARSHGNRDVVIAEETRFDAVMLRNPRVLPRAYLATPVCEPDKAAAHARILSRAFQPGQQVVLECPPSPLRDEPPASTAGPGQVRFVHYAPEEAVLDVEAREPTVLVLNDAYYSGWSATVDGQPASILPANVAVRGVRLTPGPHHVTFTYRTPGLRLGALVSLATLGLLGLAVFIERRRRPLPAGPA